MPIHAQNLHEVVLRNAPQLNEQMTRLEYSEPTVGFVFKFFYWCIQSRLIYPPSFLKLRDLEEIFGWNGDKGCELFLRYQI